jgi:hypothetical protein
MLIRIHAVAMAAAFLASGQRLPGQSAVLSAPTAETACKHCDRPTPFDKTQGVSVTIMIRDGFAKPTIDAVIRDEPGAVSTPLIAIKRTALSPALVYRAVTSLSQSRTKYNGPPPKRATTVLSSGSAFEVVPDEDRAWVASLIAQLSHAPTSDIAGGGRFPAVNFTIDTKALRVK